MYEVELLIPDTVNCLRKQISCVYGIPTTVFEGMFRNVSCCLRNFETFDTSTSTGLSVYCL